MLIAVSKIYFYIEGAIFNILKFVSNSISNSMRFIVFLLFVSLQLSAQQRVNKPLPIISKKPSSVLKKNISGWCKSIDGQWVSKKKTIPARLNSFDKKGYRKRYNKVGLDNFKDFRIYPVISGQDTLILLTKRFKDGFYKYRKSRKGWKTTRKCHYYIFNKHELDKLDALEDSLVQIVDFKLLDEGEVNYTYRGEIMNLIRQKVALKEDFGRVLKLTLQPFTANNTLRFQICSMHQTHGEVDGVLRDYRIDGKSLYGSPELFKHLYYEIDIDRFSIFFTLGESFKFKI